MRTVAALVLLFLAGSAGAQPHAARERTRRAFDVVYELDLDNPTTEKLFPILAIYERDRGKLLAEQEEIQDQLRATEDPAAADKLLDRSITKQRALLAADQKVVFSLRKLLGAQKAARARMILFAPAPDRAVDDDDDDNDNDDDDDDPQPPPRRTDLFPPGSPLRGPPGCDPFASMHGCT